MRHPPLKIRNEFLRYPALMISRCQLKNYFEMMERMNDLIILIFGEIY